MLVLDVECNFLQFQKWFTDGGFCQTAVKKCLFDKRGGHESHMFSAKWSLQRLVPVYIQFSVRHTVIYMYVYVHFINRD